MLKQSQRLTDDLFENSSMSFGDHLEELRKALTKAFIWIAIGAVIGLSAGNAIVEFIKVPLEKQLELHLIERFKLEYEKYNQTKPSSKLVDFYRENSMLPEVVWIDPLALGNINGAAATSIQDYSKDDVWKGMNEEQIARLVPFPLWRSMKSKLKTFSSLEGFMIWLKTGLVAGVVIACPGIFWHIWEFLAAGLYPHERRYVYWYMPLSITLFLSGIALAHFAIFPLVLGFLLNYNLTLDVEFEPRLTDYMSFAILLPLGFGIAFQLPVVMVALNRFGIVSVEFFVEKWRIAVLAIAFVSMLLTPADLYSMLGMFIPLTLLYFVGIFLCRFMPRGPGIGSQAFDPQP